MRQKVNLIAMQNHIEPEEMSYLCHLIMKQAGEPLKLSALYCQNALQFRNNCICRLKKIH